MTPSLNIEMAYPALGFGGGGRVFAPLGFARGHAHPSSWHVKTNTKVKGARGESQISADSVKSCATLGGAKTLPCTVRKSGELIV